MFHVKHRRPMRRRQTLVLPWVLMARELKVAERNRSSPRLGSPATWVKRRMFHVKHPRRVRP